MTESDSRRILGAFIRGHREAMSMTGKSGSRRRTPGMRREELAEAAEVSLTWITWLEQGRNVAASTSTLVRLAEALQLTPAARASLFDLAGRRDPAGISDLQADLLPELQILPNQFTGPAYLLDPTWTAKAWNESASQLFLGWLDGEEGDRNLLRYVFQSSHSRDLIKDWEDRARRILAEFRADFNRRPRDPSLQAVVEGLLAGSEFFSQHWSDQTVLNREGGERRFQHPIQGELLYQQVTLLVALQPEYKLVCLIPESSQRA